MNGLRRETRQDLAEGGDDVEEATYALRNLISAGELVIEATIKDQISGKLTTAEFLFTLPRTPPRHSVAEAGGALFSPAFTDTDHKV